MSTHILSLFLVPCADKDPEQCQKDKAEGKDYLCSGGYYKWTKCPETCGKCPKKDAQPLLRRQDFLDRRADENRYYGEQKFLH